MKKKKQYWFKAKMYGWGWYPVTWQGWLVTLVYIAAIGANSFLIDANSQSENDMVIYFVLQAFALSALLIFICFKTGEKPRWRCGK